MGNVSATNKVDQTLKVSLKTSNRIAQDCKASSSQSQAINVESDCDGDVTITGNNLSQHASFDAACLQKASITADEKTDLTNKMSQAASAVSQMISANPGSTEANNIMSSYLGLASEMENIIEQSCNIGSKQSQSINVKRSKCKGNVLVAGNNMEQYVKSVDKCVQDAIMKSSRVTNIKQTIDQTAKAEQSAFGLLILIIGIIIILILVTGGVAKSAMTVVIVIVIGLIIIGLTYLVIGAVTKKLPPFQEKPEKKPSNDYNAPKEFDTDAIAQMCIAISAYLYGINKEPWQNIRKTSFPHLKDSDAQNVRDANCNTMFNKINGKKITTKDKILKSSKDSSSSTCESSCASDNKCRGYMFYNGDIKNLKGKENCYTFNQIGSEFYSDSSVWDMYEKFL